MKKTLNVVLAVILAVAMFASVAYVASPERTSEYQISLVSVKAVNVQDATQGVRSYAELVDTTRAYQVNDVIYLAITSEVKNLEKYPTLKSIAGKDVKVVVGSPSIDLSYAKLGTPTLLANIWSGYTAVDVATVGWYAPAQVMLDYDKNANEVSWKFRGYTQYGMGTSSIGYASSTYSNDYAKLESSQLGNSYYAQNLVIFNPYFNTSTKKIEIPAIKLKKSTSKWTLGDTTYEMDYEAPDAIAYTMVLTGVTKDNAGASKGTFYAKIEISGAEKFEDYDSYWVGDNNNYYNTEAQAKAGTGGVRWLNYVKVDIKKLEIAGAYNVYKYWVPSSGVRVDIPAIYAGDHDDYNDPAEDSIVFGKVLAYAAPDMYDNATSKSGKLDTTDVAGAIRTIKAYRNYSEANSTTGKTYDFPATSVVFTNFKAIYAPGFYGGTWGQGDASTTGLTSSTAEELGKTASASTSTITRTMVDELNLTLSDNTTYQWQNVKVYELDSLQNTASGGGAPRAPLIEGVHYTTSYSPVTKVVTVRPITAEVENLYPLGSDLATAKNQWVVVYADAISEGVASFWDLDPAATLASANVGLGALTSSGGGFDRILYDPGLSVWYPVFTETSSPKSVAQAGVSLTFSNLMDQYGDYIDIQSVDNITNIDLRGVSSVTGAGTKLASGNTIYTYPLVAANTLMFYDWRDGLPTTIPLTANVWATGYTDAYAVGFTSAVTGKDANGRQYVTISGLYRNSQVASTAAGVPVWTALTQEDIKDITAGSLKFAGVRGIFTFNTATTGTEGRYTDTSVAAPSSLWENGAYPIVVGHNGITMYTICSNSNDKPYVTLATETNEFTNADDGYGIAMYDNINYSLVKKARTDVARIYRSNDTNLAYSVGATHVDDSATIISGMKYFGLDTSFGTTYKIVDATFESKGAAAVFSENVEGEFQYGTITIIPDNVEEGTEEEEVEPEEEEDPVIEEPEEEEAPVIEEPDVTPPVVKTGDASANIAIALAAAAIVAAAGLAFVMKKVR